MHYPETIRPALEVIGAHPKAGLVSGMYMLVFEKQRRLLRRHDGQHRSDGRAAGADRVSRRARIARTIGVEPRIAMLSFSNFGSVRHPEAEKMARRGRSCCGSATRR